MRLLSHLVHAYLDFLRLFLLKAQWSVRASNLIPKQKLSSISHWKLGVGQAPNLGQGSRSPWSVFLYY
jgi:hypothetical protein